MSAIPSINVSSLIHTRTTHPAFSAVEVDDPSDGGPYGSYPLANLFPPDGPSEFSGCQWQWPDCGPCSCLKAFARMRPDWLTKIMVRLPSGRIAVRWYDVHGNEKWSAVSPLISNRQCPPQADGSIWFQMLEKMLAIIAGSFTNMSGQSPFQVFNALGIKSGFYSDGTGNYFKNDAELSTALAKMTSDKQIWAVGTGGRSIIPGIMQSHYYSVVKTNPDGTIYLSNPLGSYYDLPNVKPADFIAQFSNEVTYGMIP